VPAELLRGGDGRAAPAEGVEHHVAGIAAGRDDALQKSHGLLCWVAEAFGGMGVDGWDVRPNILQVDSGHFIQKLLQARVPCACVVNQAGILKFLHVIL